MLRRTGHPRAALARPGELGRRGMAPRTCEGTTPPEHRSMVGAAPRLTCPLPLVPPVPSLRCAFGVARRSLAGQVGGAATETSSYCSPPALPPSWPGGGSCRPGSTDPSPRGDRAGVAPAQPLPAAEPTSRHRQGRLLLGPYRPSSSPWPATAGSAPPPVARCRAPGTAGRRGCRTAVRRYGTPGNANRRSAGCTDGRRPAWASSCNCQPCRSPSQARGRSPRAGESSGRSRDVTALGLVRAPTNPPAGGHSQAGAASRYHRTPGGHR
jgi:hypothetical protein